MRSITFAVSKGGVGKSLISANVGAALAQKGQEVVLVEGDPNRPLQVILGVNISRKRFRLDEIVKRGLDIQKAVHQTEFKNLYLIPSGISLQGYFDIDPVDFAKKLMTLDADFMLIDVPFPLGKAAFLSLGICEYFVPILTEDEFVLCVESAIDTIRLGQHYLQCVPLGFVLNRIKTPERFTDEFVKDLEDLLEVPCLTKIVEDQEVSKSYGGAGTSKAFLAYQELQKSEFRNCINKIATALLGELPKPKKEDVVDLVQEVIKPLKS